MKNSTFINFIVISSSFVTSSSIFIIIHIFPEYGPSIAITLHYKLVRPRDIIQFGLPAVGF